MKSFLYLGVASSAIVSSVFGQDANVTNSLSAAATTVASTAAATLFPAETVQLTDEVLSSVSAVLQNSTLSDYFNFASTDAASNSTEKRAAPKTCKLLPSDRAWPPQFVWSIFDILLGGRLIKTVPSAAPCYEDWPEYNTAECAALTAAWGTSDLQ